MMTRHVPYVMAFLVWLGWGWWRAAAAEYYVDNVKGDDAQ